MTSTDIDGLQAPHTEAERLAVEFGLLEEQVALACSDLPGHVWLELDTVLRDAQLLVLDPRMLSHPAQLDTLRRIGEIYLPQVISGCEPLAALAAQERDARTHDIEQQTMAITHYLEVLQGGLNEANLVGADHMAEVLREFFSHM
jgi:hypothetical protein